MKKLSIAISIAAMVVALGITGLGCSQANTDAAGKTADLFASKLQYSEMVEDFVQNSSTFKFDGQTGTINLTKVVATENGDGDYTVDYQTGQPGHGDRTGQVLAQVVTNHQAVVGVKDGKIISAVCDGTFDIMK